MSQKVCVYVCVCLYSHMHAYMQCILRIHGKCMHIVTYSLLGSPLNKGNHLAEFPTSVVNSYVPQALIYLLKVLGIV